MFLCMKDGIISTKDEIIRECDNCEFYICNQYVRNIGIL